MVVVWHLGQIQIKDPSLRLLPVLARACVVGVEDGSSRVEVLDFFGCASTFVVVSVQQTSLLVLLALLFLSVNMPSNMVM